MIEEEIGTIRDAVAALEHRAAGDREWRDHVEGFMDDQRERHRENLRLMRQILVAAIGAFFAGVVAIVLKITEIVH